MKYLRVGIYSIRVSQYFSLYELYQCVVDLSVCEKSVDEAFVRYFPFMSNENVILFVSFFLVAIILGIEKKTSVTDIIIYIVVGGGGGIRFLKNP